MQGILHEFLGTSRYLVPSLVLCVVLRLFWDRHQERKARLGTADPN